MSGAGGPAPVRVADAPPGVGEPLLSVRDLRIDFRSRREAPTAAVRGIGFAIRTNRCVALVGESGSGKTATALAILRLLPAQALVSGAIRFAGRDLAGLDALEMRKLRGSAISMIFQDPSPSLNPVFSIGAQIVEALRIHERMHPRSAAARAVELLADVGLPDPARRFASYPHELSGGQQQRAMIAMAIACRPRLLIADEPTSALDATIQRQILQLLQRLRERYAMSMLFITHDLGVVGEIADEVLVLRAGQVCEQGTVRQIFTAASHPYTRALLACRPSLTSRPHRLATIADSEAGASAPPPPRAARTGGELVLEVEGLSQSYRRRESVFRSSAFPAVSAVSFSLCRGRTLGIVGESGSGKTSLALTLMRLLPAQCGRVILHGRGGAQDLLAAPRSAIGPLRRRMQIVFQNPYASLNPRFTIGQSITEPMAIHGIGAHAAERLALAAALLERVGLAGDAVGRYPHEFSGGQRQRMAIARALTLRPDVLICDEPVSSLDVSVQAQVLNLLLDLQDEFGLSYLFISHDLAVVRHMADEVLVLEAGVAVERASADSIYRAPGTDYTRRLLEAVPRGYVAGE